MRMEVSSNPGREKRRNSVQHVRTHRPQRSRLTKVSRPPVHRRRLAPMNRRTRAWTVAATLVATAALTTPATDAVPFKEIVSPAGPLTSVALRDELSCQVAYSGDARFELFPSASKPGDCGT